MGKIRLVDAAEYQAWLRAFDAWDIAGSEIEDGANEVLLEMGIHERPGAAKTSDRGGSRRRGGPGKST